MRKLSVLIFFGIIFFSQGAKAVEIVASYTRTSTLHITDVIYEESRSVTYASLSGTSGETQNVDNLTQGNKKLEVVLWLVSRHNGYGGERDWWKECDRKRPGRNYGYNECNWGLGLRYYHEEGWLGGKRFTEVGSLKNSLEGRLNMAATGVLYDVAKVGNVTLTASAAGVVGRYTLRHGESRNAGAIAFEFGGRYKELFSTNLSCIPRATFKQFVVCTLNVRIPFTL